MTMPASTVESNEVSPLELLFDLVFVFAVSQSARFAHSWPTTTRHLAVLVDAGLISVTPLGRERHYRLERQRLGDVVALWLPSVGFELRPALGSGDGA